MKSIRIGAILAGWIAVVGLSHAAMYKWVDEKGVTQYTQYPPPNRQHQVVVPPPPPAQDPQGAQQKLEQTLQKLDEQRQGRAEAEAEQAKAKQESERREQNCRAARSNLQALTSGGRKRVMGADGVATYLTEEDRQSRIAEAKRQIEEYCQPQP